jgi:DNA-binding MarR family transcriptional regulator
VRELERYLSWEDQLFSNPHLSPTHKLALRATRRAAERSQTHDEQGKARVNLGIIAEQIGVSEDTVSRSLKLLESVGAINKETRHELQETGDLWRRVYVDINPTALEKPRELAPEQPRNHGGKRYICPACGSERVTIRKKITLVCSCGHESLIEETEQTQEPERPAMPQDAATGTEAPTRKLRDIIKPVSPPISCKSAEAPGEETPLPQDAARLSEPRDLSTSHQERPLPQDAARGGEEAMQEAAALLVAMAGPARTHIEMCKTGPKKYTTINRPLSQTDALYHLRGGQARGALCSYPTGQTHALCYDADDAECWRTLESAARALAEAGYLPILEPSPAQRGGHLWIIFDALVDAGAARSHAHQLAPTLAEITEYWPGPATAKNWNRVRLPGGKYRRPEVNAWCRLVSVADGEAAREGGLEAARLLLSHQTPTALVPQIGQGVPRESLDTPQAPAKQPAAPSPSISETPAEVDQHWQGKYGTDEGKRLWFAFPATYVAAWWNERHSVDDLLPSERNGYGLATWRGEREGSVAKRGEKWADFGQSARRADGSPDTGDALELQQRLTQAPKPELLRQAAKELLAQARADLESAARSGQPIPAWLEEIITDAGRAHYARLYAGSPAPTQEHTGGVTGFQNLLIATDAAPGVEPERAAPAMKPPLGVPSGDTQEQKTMLRAWAERHNWQAIEVDGQRYGGDGRTWQLGLSLWWSVVEIQRLAEYVSAL